MEEGAAWDTRLGCKTASSGAMGHCQADVQQVKESEAGRAGLGWARINSIDPSNDAHMGAYYMFCDNPTYSTQNHSTSLQLEGTLEVI